MLQTGSFLLLVLTLYFTPLAFGTTETWSMAVAELVVGIAFFLFFSQSNLEVYKPPGIVPLVALLIFAGLQCIPLPPQLVRLVSPHIYASFQPFFIVQGNSTWIPLTLHLRATIFEWLRLSCSVLLYILAVQLLSRKSRLKITVDAVCILAVFLAYLAVLQKLISPDKIYGFRDVPASAWQGALGPWVNPNQYAGFMVMVFPLVLARFFALAPEQCKRSSFKERCMYYFSDPTGNLKLFLAFCLALFPASIFLSHSRGGILSVCLELVFFLFCLSRKKIVQHRVSTILFIAALLLTAIVFNYHPVIEKFLSTMPSWQEGLQDGRIAVWHDILQIIRDYPITGTGFGSFADVFPLYKSFTDIYVYDHAHNDYLELLSDGGIIACLLFGWFMLHIIKTGWQQLHKRHSPYAVLLTTAALSGIIGMLLYSLTDFNLHNGANGIYFFFLCALVVSAGHTRVHGQRCPALPRVNPSLIKQTGILCFSVFFIVLTVLIMGGAFLGEKSYVKAVQISGSMMRMEKKTAQVNQMLTQAWYYDRLSAKYSYALTNISLQKNTKKKAREYCLVALYNQPLQLDFITKAAQIIQDAQPEQAAQLLSIAAARRARPIHPPSSSD